MRYTGTNDEGFSPLQRGVIREIREDQNRVDRVQPHELHQFLEFVLEKPFYYGHHSISMARELVDKGCLSSNGRLYTAMMVPREDGGTVVLTEEPMSFQDFMKACHLRASMKTPSAHTVMKRMKRLLSPHEQMAHGRIIEDGGDIITVQLDEVMRQRRDFASGKMYAEKISISKEIRVRRLKGCPLNDGMSLLSHRLVRILTGDITTTGAGFKLTAMDMRGQYKGHAMVYPDLAYDAVLYDPKKDLQLVDGHFVIGFLGNLKPTMVFTDLQSVLNFQLEDRLVDWAITYMDDIAKKCSSLDGIAEALGLLDEVGVQDFNDSENETRVIDGSELKWMVADLIRGGVDVSKIPALRRRIIQMLLKVIDISGQRVRIPIPESEAIRRYANVDPRLFDREGNLNVENRDGQLFPSGPAHDIPNGVWMPGLDATVQELSFYRQPNGCKEEVETLQTYNADDKDEFLSQFKDSPFLFISPWDIEDTMKKLGGGDLDDPLVVFKTMNDKFSSLGFLPEAPDKYSFKKPVAMSKISERWLRHFKPSFNEEAVKRVIEDLIACPITIGQVVNAVMVCQAMLQSGLIEEIPAPVLHLARSVERVVDSLKKSGESATDIQKALDDYIDWLKQQKKVPVFLLRQRGRIPERHNRELVKEHLVGVVTKYDKVLSSIEALKQEFRARDIENSYLDVQIPEEIDKFEVNEDSRVLAGNIRRYYNFLMARRMSVINQQAEGMEKLGVPLSEIDQTLGPLRQEAYRESFMTVYATYKDEPLVAEAFIQLWKDVYSVGNEVKRTATGQPYFPDGILWGLKTEKGLPAGTALLSIKALLRSKGVEFRLPELDLSDWLKGAPAPIRQTRNQRQSFVMVSPGTDPEKLVAMQGMEALVVPVPTPAEFEDGERFIPNARVLAAGTYKPIGFVSQREINRYYTTIGCSDFRKLSQALKDASDQKSAMEVIKEHKLPVTKVVLGTNPGSSKTLQFALG